MAGAAHVFVGPWGGYGINAIGISGHLDDNVSVMMLV